MGVLSPEAIEVGTEIFKEVDADGSGSMDAKEIHSAIKKMAEKDPGSFDPVPTEEQVAARLGELPTKEEGKVSLEEWLMLLGFIKVMVGLTAMFMAIDADGSGTIDAKEVEGLMTKLHEAQGLPPPDKAKCEEIVNTVGTDGQIYFDQFVAFVVSKVAMEAA